MSKSEFEKTIDGPGGTQIKAYADNTAEVVGQGVRAHVEEGHVRVTLDQVRKVSIDNIIDVILHKVERSDTAVSHHVTFEGGGEMRFSYRKDGKLLEFSCRNGLQVSIEDKGTRAVVGKGQTSTG